MSDFSFTDLTTYAANVGIDEECAIEADCRPGVTADSLRGAVLAAAYDQIDNLDEADVFDWTALIAERGARAEYLALFPSVREASEHEQSVLNAVPRDMLPEHARIVLDDGEATHEYWQWLIEQRSAADGKAP